MRVYNGGSAAMAAPQCSSVRHIWLFDSFEGLPLPTEDDGVYERENYHNGGEGSIEKVKEISKYRFSQPTSSYNQGWFENTLRAKRRKLDRLLFTHRR